MKKLVDCFDEDLPETVSENLAKATVKTFLTMCLRTGKSGTDGCTAPGL